MKRLKINVSNEIFKDFEIPTKQSSFTLDELEKLAKTYQVPFSEFFKPMDSTTYHGYEAKAPVKKTTDKFRMEKLAKSFRMETLKNPRLPFLDMADKLNIKPEELAKLAKYLLKKSSK